MISTHDEGKGVVLTYWQDIRDRVAKVEPTFANIVDKLNPDKSFPMFLFYYPYGELIADTKSLLIPTTEKNSYRLMDPNAPKEIIKHLSYGQGSLPLCMLLEKEIEYFIDFRDKRITVPWWIFSPGAFFPLGRALIKKNHRVYVPNGLLSAISGARSVFMLPSIGCATHHANLQRDFNIQNPAPKTLYEHWSIFKEITASPILQSDWCSCLLFFSEKWFNKIQNDKAWLELKLYLHEMAWKRFEYAKNRTFYDITFSVIQKKRNLKPNPYLADTARHLFAIALGAVPGFIPACNENALPVELLQKVFIESYGLNKYYPNILHPYHFMFEEDNQPVYYSLQNPTTHIFSPKSRTVNSTLHELRELAHITRVFTEELREVNSMCSDTIIHQVAKEIRFDYFHNILDQHNVIKLAKELEKLDGRFAQLKTAFKAEGAQFAIDAPFVRGCVAIQNEK